MDRRDLLKQTCGMGLCACAMSGIMTQAAQAGEAGQTSPDTDRRLRELRGQLDHGRKRFAKLCALLESRLDEKTRLEIFEQLGRDCASTGGDAKKFKGNPDGFCRQMKEMLGEGFAFDKEKGIITITGPEKDCACSLVNSKITPACFCQCTIGWQKETCEAVFGKKVEVEIKESVLRGSKRCACQVRILS